MISKVFLVLRDVVNDYLSANTGWSSVDSDFGQVVFVESEKVDVVDFKMGAVSLLLINIEEEHSIRPADLYHRVLADGTQQSVAPPIHLNLYVLFVARFADYQQSLRCTSLILQFFQARRVLDHENTPALDDRIEQLTMELVTLPLGEQNHLWGILRTAYQPSLLYRARMIVFRDDEPRIVPPVAEPIAGIHP